MARKKRKSTGTRLRMEVLKRDGFRCVYCGATPMQAMLHADHVVPVIDGGPTDASNLVTSCRTCNLGKSSIPLTERRVPALDPEAAAEHAEQLEAYLEATRAIQHAKQALTEEALASWRRYFDCDMARGIAQRLPSLLSEFGVSWLDNAFGIIAGHPSLGASNYASPTRQADRTRYFFGIVRRQRASTQPVPTQPEPETTPTQPEWAPNPKAIGHLGDIASKLSEAELRLMVEALSTRTRLVATGDRWHKTFGSLSPDTFAEQSVENCVRHLETLGILAIWPLGDHTWIGLSQFEEEGA